MRETRIVARLRVALGPSYDSSALVSRIAEENLFQYPTEREVKSRARACDRRLSSLSDDEHVRDALMGLVTDGTPEQAALANLYAMARDNRIVWDFLSVTVAHKLRTHDPALSRHEIVSFLADLRLQDERVASWSDATLNKIRQVLTNALEGCGMYDRKSERLEPPLPDRCLTSAIRQNGDLVLLSVFGVIE